MTINKQAAIDAVKKHYRAHDNDLLELIAFDIERLPSAQPEIIRCKDCKHSKHWYRDKRRCFLWAEDGVDVFDDGFCNYAKRREE